MSIREYSDDGTPIVVAKPDSVEVSHADDAPDGLPRSYFCEMILN